jgi:hypothetical protein
MLDLQRSLDCLDKMTIFIKLRQIPCPFLPAIRTCLNTKTMSINQKKRFIGNAAEILHTAFKDYSSPCYALTNQDALKNSRMNAKERMMLFGHHELFLKDFFDLHKDNDLTREGFQSEIAELHASCRTKNARIETWFEEATSYLPYPTTFGLLNRIIKPLFPLNEALVGDRDYIRYAYLSVVILYEMLHQMTVLNTVAINNELIGYCLWYLLKLVPPPDDWAQKSFHSLFDNRFQEHVMQVMDMYTLKRQRGLMEHCSFKNDFFAQKVINNRFPFTDLFDQVSYDTKPYVAEKMHTSFYGKDFTFVKNKSVWDWLTANVLKPADTSELSDQFSNQSMWDRWALWAEDHQSALQIAGIVTGATLTAVLSYVFLPVMISAAFVATSSVIGAMVTGLMGVFSFSGAMIGVSVLGSLGLICHFLDDNKPLSKKDSTTFEKFQRMMSSLFRVGWDTGCRVFAWSASSIYRMAGERIQWNQELIINGAPGVPRVPEVPEDRPQALLLQQAAPAEHKEHKEHKQQARQAPQNEWNLRQEEVDGEVALLVPELNFPAVGGYSERSQLEDSKLNVPQNGDELSAKEVLDNYRKVFTEFAGQCREALGSQKTKMKTKMTNEKKKALAAFRLHNVDKIMTTEAYTAWVKYLTCLKSTCGDASYDNPPDI